MQIGCSRGVLQEECLWKVVQERCSKARILGSQDTGGCSGVGMQEGAESKGCLKVRIELDTQGKDRDAWEGYSEGCFGVGM